MLQSMRSSAKYIWIFLIIFFVGGFLLAETSGLIGRGPITTTTAVATVNGEDILATTWYNATSALEQQATQQSGRGATLDERKRLSDQAFEQLVADVLLKQEYERRGIRVSDAEVAEAARLSPPPQLAQNPELQTDGQFDPDKYRRFLSSPAARQEGLLVQLEQYYRDAVPREKLFEQVAADVYVSDERLWSIFKDSRDTAQISYVAFRPEMLADSAVTVAAGDIREYYNRNKKDFERPSRAVVSVLAIPRSVTTADSVGVRNRLLALRARIAGGEKFEDVARAESTDSASAASGGSLGSGPRGRFVPAFEDAAFALAPGEVSQPILSPFGYHLIRVDERKGDTLSLRHILLPVLQGDSAATATDRRADDLARLAASSDDPAVFDQAAARFGIPVKRAAVLDTDALVIDGKFIPSVGPWAFQGVQPGETSELFDADDGYYLARLDSVRRGGVPSLEQATPEIRRLLARRLKLDQMMPRARQFAAAASSTSLEQAAQTNNVRFVKSEPFTRVSGAEGIGRLNEAIGAAFSLPIGVVSQAIRTFDAIFVQRVDRRTVADRAEWEQAKPAQRAQVTTQLRQQRVRDFLTNLRESADITDRRREIEAANRQAVDQQVP